ncbi:hypothetical protein FDA94_32830 [Herbidospora galbida]|uniref:DUF1850 domain-containing protein n=1 Tax=Herbidospora galbida TaxID=2575442 RepID=A0A4U3M4A6_9ACTN|nr:hypothetical protein [Herbidospora galbida]TKK83638.1 hypothetical protein FDA94_32830 [Herbidospora galbida]
MMKASPARRLKAAALLVWLLPALTVEAVLVRLGLRPRPPVPMRNPDGSVTVTAIVHGFPVPVHAFSHHGWVPGDLTVYPDRVVHQPSGPDEAHSFIREGAIVTVGWPGEGVLKRGVMARVRVDLPDGRVIRINLRTAYKEVVEDLAGRPLGRRAAGY